MSDLEMAYWIGYGFAVAIGSLGIILMCMVHRSYYVQWKTH